MLLPSGVLQAWCHTPATAAHTLVLPDGCRDLILRATPGQAPQWLVTALADTAYGVASAAGESFWGYRFHPGATVDEAALLKALHDRQPCEAHDPLPLIDEFVRLDGRVTEALQSLSDAPRVATAACHLGVSERSLERLIRGATGRAPSYWKGLARIRRAALALSGTAPLAAIAADHGYADQAHMSREFRRWFDVSPSRFQASSNLLRVVAESGYG